MSSVRMCDQCGTVFSENADDWTTYTGTKRVKNAQTGERYTQTRQLDACPACTKKMEDISAVTPSGELNGSVE